MNIAAHMRRAGGAFAHQPAVAQGAAVLQTYGALADRVSRLAQALRGHLGLLPGVRVALVMKNCPEYLEILYACWHAGLVAVPINAYNWLMKWMREIAGYLLARPKALQVLAGLSHV